MPYANNKGADPRSLISDFVVHCLDSIITLVSISKVSSLYLACAGRFESCLFANPEDRFSRDVAHLALALRSLCFRSALLLAS